jgi:hypothetical protein
VREGLFRRRSRIIGKVADFELRFVYPSPGNYISDAVYLFDRSLTPLVAKTFSVLSAQTWRAEMKVFGVAMLAITFRTFRGVAQLLDCWPGSISRRPSLTESLGVFPSKSMYKYGQR